jgi:chorismate mutase/prephenate dehydrogenase
MSESELEILRAELADLDIQILDLAARRRDLAMQIGKRKQIQGTPTRDFAQEKRVISRAVNHGVGLKLNPNTVQELMLLLIRSSLTVQEKDRVATGAHGADQSALVIGGSGRMGGWFARYLNAQGFAVEISDPSPSPDGFPQISDWRGHALNHDIIVVATPLRITDKILLELAEKKPAGLIFDIGSLKSPLRKSLQILADRQMQITSVHPMFGPDVELLSGRHVIFVDVGNPEATSKARALFEPTMASLLEMDLDTHDQIMARVLGLSHALNIAFFATLAEGADPQSLHGISSTTFDAQMSVAARVAQENPHLYYEVQALNDYGPEILSTLKSVVSELHRMVANGEEDVFVSLMERGRAFLDQLD